MRPRVKRRAPTTGGGAYFASPSPEIEFVSSGAALLDCVLGGGWALGRVVNVVGDRSSGKCARDGYIITAHGIERLEDLGELFPYGPSAWEHKLALDRDGKTCSVSHFYKERVNLTHRVRTEHGFDVCATPDHKIMVFTECCTFEMRRMQDIKPGDYVPVVSGTNLYPKKSPPVAFTVEVPYRSSSPPMAIPKTISEDWALLLGFFVADGTLSSGPAIISAEKKWKRDALRSVLDRLAVPYVERADAFAFGSQVRQFLSYLFDGVDGKTAKHKHVPKHILRSPKSVQVAFLRSLISCDSEMNNVGCTYATASRRLAQEVRTMLLNLGVCATYFTQQRRLAGWEASRTYHYLSIHGQRYREFLTSVGSLRSVVAAKGDNDRTSSSYLSVPYLADVLRFEIGETRKRLGWSRNGKFKGGGYSSSPLALRRLFMRRSESSGSHISKRMLRQLLPELSFWVGAELTGRCKTLLDSGYVFEKVIANEIERGPQDVYDVHVPKGHLFWFNGFVSHNTLLAIEAFANFHRSYPKGVMFYNEVESAFDKGYAAALGLPVGDIQFSQSETVEQFHDDLVKRIDALGKDEPALYVLDSLDALSDAGELDRDLNEGSYGTGKAKQMSQLFRRLIRKLGTKRVLLVIISQVRDNIGVTFGSKVKRSGGRALDFYASQVLFLAQRGTIKKTINKVERAIGVSVRAKCSKNKVGLPLRECEFDIRFGYGVDDVAAALQWLSEIGRLETVGLNKAQVPGFVRRFEDMDRQEAFKRREEINAAVRDEWYKIETGFLPKRSKYA